jgi:adenylate kinase
MALRIIILGEPGAGKGTYSAELVKHYQIPQISTGDMLRAAIKMNSPVGLKAQEYMKQGALVPDSVVIELIRQRVKEPDAQQGFILDGFPRTLVQAESLDELLKANGIPLTLVVKLDISREILIQRLTGRRICQTCGSVFNVFTMKPKKEGICDKCNGELIQRPDDQMATIENRLEVYQKQTAPLIHFYEGKGILEHLQAENSIENVFRKFLSIINERL